MARLSASQPRVLYVSAAMRPRTYEDCFRETAHWPSQATQKYDSLLINGLAANHAEVIALSAPPITPATCGKRFVHLRPEAENGVFYRYLPVVGIPVLKQLITWASCFCNVLRYGKRNAYVLCYGLNAAAAGGARAAAKLLRLPAAVIVSDVPEQLGNGLVMRMAQRGLTRYDGYVLLAEAMRPLVNPHNKPAVILEGQADASMLTRKNTLENKCKEKVCLYAGMLHAKYGVLRLTEAFMQLPDPDARLVLYGTGDATDTIAKAAKQDARIWYRGTVDNAAVVDAELSATLLVNPRPSDETYTKYSFPSKNLEYMASGTPLLTTRLPGMPAEYEPYVYFFDEETPAGMAASLHSVLSLSRETLHDRGLRAKAFVLNEKSNTAQALRIIQFLEGLRT